MDTEQMELLMRRLRSQHHDIKQGAHYTPTEDPSWDATNDAAEALLAEHDARVAAERELGQWELRKRSWEQAIADAEARAEQAERERDRLLDVMALDTMAVRVATLEAALNRYGSHYLDCDPEDDGECTCGLDALIGSFRWPAALGDQEAPTEPPTGYDRTTMWALLPDHFDEPAAPQVAPTEPPHRSIGKVYEPNGWGDCEVCGRPWPCPQARIDYIGTVGITPPHAVNVAPQVAPEPWTARSVREMTPEQVAAHRRHMTDGRWHDDCRACEHRRVYGGTGLEPRDAAQVAPEPDEDEQRSMAEYATTASDLYGVAPEPEQCPVNGCINRAQPPEKWPSCFYDGSPCQPAPEPERCPTCGSADRDSAFGPECLFDGEYDAWHDRPAPLVEGEQG